MICCVRKRDQRGAIGRQAPVLRHMHQCADSACRREHRPALESQRDDIVQWLLDSQRNAGGLRVKAQLQRAFVIAAKAVASSRAPRCGGPRDTWQSLQRSRYAR